MAESELELSHRIEASGVCLVSCRGVLDAHTSGRLDRLIEDVTRRGITRVACDLSEVNYIASAGVGVFVGHVNACRENGGDLVLVHPLGFGGDGEGTGLQQGYNVLEVFNLLGLADFLRVVKTPAEALSLLEGSQPT